MTWILIAIAGALLAGMSYRLGFASGFQEGTRYTVARLTQEGDEEFKARLQLVVAQVIFPKPDAERLKP